jgi:glycosyltransferase involved in cell wall biosynthesis
MEYDLLVLSQEWDGLPFSCKHLVRHFLPSTTVLWAQILGLRSPGLSSYDLRRAMGKIRGWLMPRRPTVGSTNLHILDPFQVPYIHLPLVRAFNRRSITSAVRKFYRGRPLRPRVVLTTWPFVGDIVGSLGENLSIYYRVDDYSEFPGVRKDFLRRAERELVSKVDLVVASSRKLMEMSSPGKPVMYLPHGVDCDHFCPQATSTGSHPCIERVPAPRIGFFGLLSAWIDLDLIADMARIHPDWSIVLLGPSQISASALPQMPNIHYLGRVSYEELPGYARHFQAAIIPFKVGRLAEAVNPLKLLEYLSLGLPVVSTPLPEVQRFRDHVLIASGSVHFAEAVAQSLASDSPDSRRKRRNAALAHSWQSRSLELKRWIDDEFERRIAVSQTA